MKFVDLTENHDTIMPTKSEGTAHRNVHCVINGLFCNDMEMIRYCLIQVACVYRRRNDIVDHGKQGNYSFYRTGCA